MVFPVMLVSSAEEAGIAVPPDPDKFDAEAFPHFQVFCTVQLGRRMTPGEDFGNARVIAALGLKEIKTITLEGLIAKGLVYST